MPSTIKRVRHAVLTASTLSTVASAVVDLVNATETSAPKPGDLVFQTDFEASQQREAWSQADLAECFLFRTEVVVQAALLDTHAFGDIPGAGAMEAFLGKHRGGCANRLLSLLEVSVAG